MKMFFLCSITLIAAVLLFFLGCTGDAAQNQSDDTPPILGKDNTILVAYFSKTGTTETIAGYIHDKAGGDIFKIVTVNPYPVDYNATLTQAQQELSSNSRPALSGSVSNMDAYDIIF
jgi:ABC-type glycerol-3-phosphate transport system substrate-binding protein